MNKILIINSGSSSWKISLFEIKKSILAEPEKAIWEKNVNLEELELSDDIAVVGHRIVHAGEFQRPTLITDQVKDAIRKYSPLAPLHNPKSLEAIEIIQKKLPGIPQIAIFDTGFHAEMPDFANTYAGPYSWKEQGIKRYGFHGINYEYCTARASFLLRNSELKIVCCHLGSGASMAAIYNGRSIDTTMGFTPLEGLMMGSRSGSIDPGILFYLKKTTEELFHTLNFESGLKGISGRSSDMREILKLCLEGHELALLSYDMYIHSLKRNLGAMTAVLEGLDAVVFTAGIGEHSAEVRKSVCMGLKHFGISIDDEKNQNNESNISSGDAKVAVLVIPAEEDWCMACTLQKMRSLWT